MTSRSLNWEERDFGQMHTFSQPQTVPPSTVKPKISLSLLFFFLSTLQRESTAIFSRAHLSFKVSSRWVWRQSVMTRGSCVVRCSNVCFVWAEEFLVMNFTHHIHHCGWPMSFVKAWPVVFFFNKSRGEAKQAHHQSSCQDLTLWLAQYIGGDI